MLYIIHIRQLKPYYFCHGLVDSEMVYDDNFELLTALLLEYFTASVECICHSGCQHSFGLRH